MGNTFNELEQILADQLRLANNLRNQVESKENEKGDLLKDIAVNIIDALDSFELVEDGLKEKGYLEIDEVNRTVARYKNIQRKLLNTLHRYGISRIDFPDNRLIVGLCEVVDTESSLERRNDEIITIVRNGYIRGKELIRPAQIIVVKN